MESEDSTESLIRDRKKLAVLGINVNSSTFGRIFSKLEFLTAFSYLRDIVDKNSIPYHSVEYEGYALPGDHIDDLVLKKIGVIGRKTASTISTPSEYQVQFSALEKWGMIRSHGQSNLGQALESIRKTGIKNVFLSGFITEFNILGASFETIKRGMVPVVISDAVSSPNERLHFHGLEILSNFCFIADSRDLMKGWDT